MSSAVAGAVAMAAPSAGLRDPIPIPNTSVSVPRLGFGVYQLYSQACQRAVLAALDAGFRHVDSAQLYRNESDVAAAVRRSALHRRDVFLTTKIMGSAAAAASPDAAYRLALDSVVSMGGPGDDSYVDLFLVHAPGASRTSREYLWKALERLYREGRAKAIGVSNFRVDHLEEMKEYATVWPPHVNQLELHPWCQQRDLVRFCRDNAIVLQAYSPLSCGENLGDATLAAVAAKHAKSPAQVLIRYAPQKDWAPLPKSGTRERIQQNADVFDFALGSDDMATLDALDRGKAGAIFPANLR